MNNLFSKLFIILILCVFATNAMAQKIINGQRVYDRAAGETPSKLPVPRFVSLKYEKVNSRAGPDQEYPLRFVYRRRGLPVKVIAETDDWRRIEDPEGTKVWVHKRVLDAKQTLIIKSSSLHKVKLYKSYKENARIIASLNNGVIAEIIEKREGLRKIKVGRYTGWIKANDAWGA